MTGCQKGKPYHSSWPPMITIINKCKQYNKKKNKQTNNATKMNTKKCTKRKENWISSILHVIRAKITFKWLLRQQGSLGGTFK